MQDNCTLLIAALLFKLSLLKLKQIQGNPYPRRQVSGCFFDRDHLRGLSPGLVGIYSADRVKSRVFVQSRCPRPRGHLLRQKRLARIAGRAGTSCATHTARILGRRGTIVTSGRKSRKVEQFAS